MFKHYMKYLFRPMVQTARRWAWRLRGSRSGDGFSFFKQERLCRLGTRYGCSTLVETGTFLGDTVAAVRCHFDRVLSVELSGELFEQNKRRFKYASNVMLWEGDSSTVLPQMLLHVRGRALFWLDGHYSGAGTAKGPSECPVLAELASIARHPRKDHCILIDDARHFGQAADYPSFQTVRDLLLAINPAYQITIENDCITALPPIDAEGG